ATAENEPVSTTRTRTPSAPKRSIDFLAGRKNHSSRCVLIAPMQEDHLENIADRRCASAGSSPRRSQPDPRRKARRPMSKLLAIVAILKSILVAASVAFARSDMLPVILISILFNLVQLGAKPGAQAAPRHTVEASRSHDEGR